MKKLNFTNKSSAQIINRKEVEVTAPDGEVFTVLCQILKNVQTLVIRERKILTFYNRHNALTQ